MNDINEQMELAISLQEVGANILANELRHIDPDTNIKHIDPEWALITSKIGDIDSVIFCKTVMYPKDYDEMIDQFMPVVEEIINDINRDGKLDEMDCYVIGLGAIQKYVDSDEEKGTFRFGGKYAASFGAMRLVKKAKAYELGYSCDNPLPVDNISCEYAMLKHVMSDNGVVFRKNRVGSMRSANGHIVDKWVLDVFGFDKIFRYRYAIYMDPNAEAEESCLKKLFYGVPIGEWSMPKGFKSLWREENSDEAGRDAKLNVLYEDAARSARCTWIDSDLKTFQNKLV